MKTERPYVLYRLNGKVAARMRPGYVAGRSRKVTDPNELIYDGDLLRIGKHRFILVVSSDAPIEWEETYGIFEQMVAIWGKTKARTQLGMSKAVFAAELQKRREQQAQKARALAGRA